MKQRTWILALALAVGSSRCEPQPVADQDMDDIMNDPPNTIDGSSGDGSNDLEVGDTGDLPGEYVTCQFTCNDDCQHVCEAFEAGQGTLWVLPTFGYALLEADSIRAQASVVFDATTGSYELVLLLLEGDPQDWSGVGLRLVQTIGRDEPPLNFELGELGPIDEHSDVLEVTLAPITPCDFERVELVRTEDGATLAESGFRNPGEGGTWLCTTTTFIDPYATCGNSSTDSFSFDCI